MQCQNKIYYFGSFSQQLHDVSSYKFHCTIYILWIQNLTGNFIYTEELLTCGDDCYSDEDDGALLGPSLELCFF